MRKSKIDSTVADKLKANKLLQIEGINFGSVIATEIYDQSIYAYIKHLAKCLLYNFAIEFTGDDKTKLFIYSLNYTGRRDYNEIKDLFLEYCPEYAFVDVDRVKGKKGITRKIISIIKKSAKYQLNRVPSSFLTAILVTEYYELLKLYRMTVDWEKVKWLGTFADARCEDNIAAQIGIQKKAKTFTLQHGQYRILRPGFENADAESYKNFISDKLLAWGEATRDEFVKYGIGPERVVPVGALKSFSFNKPLENIVDSGVFGVIMCGDTYIPSNTEMIKMANEIAKKLNMKYFVRFHPRNDLSLYKPVIDKKYLEGESSKIGNEEYANIVTFSLIHMTGVFVEMLSINSPIFIYDDHYLEEVFRITEFCVKDSEDFMKKFGTYKDKLSSLKEEQYKYYRYYNSDGILKDNYRCALRNMEGT